MFKADVPEAMAIMRRALTAMVTIAPTRGRAALNLRRACAYLQAYAAVLIRDDAAGAPLADCFDLAVTAGITQKQLSYVRATALAEAPVSIGAILIRDSIVEMCLSAEARVIADMTFTNREDVERLKRMMNEAFAAAEEAAADVMDQMTYRALTALHAAVTFHLIETGRPLPRMLNFEFAQSMPTLVTAHRLYYDAGRADELRAENKVVHPAFMLPTGRALSA
jgi:prophage DNA circulation protein